MEFCSSREKHELTHVMWEILELLPGELFERFADEGMADLCVKAVPQLGPVVGGHQQSQVTFAELPAVDFLNVELGMVQFPVTVETEGEKGSLLKGTTQTLLPMELR